MKNRFVPLLFIFAAALVLLSQSGLLPQASETNTPQLKVAFMDVGQGDSILLTTPNRKQILVDGGPNSSVLTRLGEEMRFNEHAIDLMVVSHNHSDHITGLNHVLERYDVKKVWIAGAIHTTNEYLELLRNIKNKGVPTEVVWSGKTETIDGVTLQVLHPLQDSTGLTPGDQHDATIVMKVVYGAKSFLLTGDIDEIHEQAIIKSLGDSAGTTLKTDVLKVPHHGSKSGLALNFLNFAALEYAVIQVGGDNKFGHPAPSILEKLKNKGVQVLRNDQNGTVRFSTDGESLQLLNP